MSASEPDHRTAAAIECRRLWRVARKQPRRPRCHQGLGFIVMVTDKGPVTVPCPRCGAGASAP